MAHYNFINNRGVIVPDLSTTKQEVEDEWVAVFGNELILDPSTPQGMIITRIIEERDSIARNNADLANQINPDLASGVFLDALMGLNGNERKPGTLSVINGVVMTGTPSTIIPAGSIASTSAGARFELLSSVVLGVNGNATGTFIAVEEGAVGANAHTLVEIISNVNGWATVDNPNAAVLGRSEEQDFQLKRRRKETLAIQSMSFFDAVTARLSELVGVTSWVVLENPKHTTETVAGLSLVPHSLWVCVDGGDSTQIAEALFRCKTGGSVWSTASGADLYNILEPHSNQTYQVYFSRPNEKAIKVRVSVKSTIGLDSDTLVKDYIENYIDGLFEGDKSFGIGDSISPFEIAAAINQGNPNIHVTKVEIAAGNSNSYSTDVYAISINEVARLQRSSITVQEV